MYDAVAEQLVELFQEYLTGWSWEDWQSTGSADKEEIVANAIADLGPAIEVEEAYDIFYDWAAGLTPADFGDSTTESLTEAQRVVTDPDLLYHATEAVNLYNIFQEDTLRGNVNTKAGINAVCLTSDKRYTIYKYPCKIELSRSRLTADGYKFVPYDEFEDDLTGRGESEERVIGDITELSKYTTALYIDWTRIAIANSSRGEVMAGPKYDKRNNEGEVWPLLLSDFIAMLRRLKAKGVRILTKGQPMKDVYEVTDNGKLIYLTHDIETAV